MIILTALFSLIYGMTAALAALILQTALTTLLPLPSLTAPVTGAATLTILIILFALIEELAKLIAVIGTRSTSIVRTLLNATAVGIGFAAVEHALIALAPYDANPFLTGATTGTVIIHIATTILIASLLLLLRTVSPILRIATTLIVVTLLHASYNILALTDYAPGSAPQQTLLGIITALAISGAVAALITSQRSRVE